MPLLVYFILLSLFPAFNKFFGIKTDFAAVQPITDHGVPLVVPGAKSAPSSNPVNSATVDVLLSFLWLHSDNRALV